MTDGSSCSAFETPLGDELEERLTLAQPQLHAYLALRSRRITGVEPEDLAQEVVARALLYRDKFDPTRELWPWLRQVALRVVTDHQVIASRRAEELLETDVEAPTQVPMLDLREELVQTLATLTSVEREALLRFHQREESVREIATAMQMPEGTVKSHLSRARRRLAGLSDLERNDE